RLADRRRRAPGQPGGRHRRRKTRHRGGAARGVVRMIIVTGAAGFIGSNLVRALNARGERDIVAADYLSRADQLRNLVHCMLVDCEIVDYIDKQEFLANLDRYRNARLIFHQGACSDTMETDGRYMMENNYRYSLALLKHAGAHRVRFIYASSAAVYGGSDRFV